MKAAQTLLKKLEGLAHAARMKHMVEVGRQARGDAAIAATLGTLEKGGFYERFLALQSCFGSGDGAHAVRALHDPSRTIQGRAPRLIALFAGDEQARKALQVARAEHRQALLAWLRKRKRLRPIDAFLDHLGENEPGELGKLLPFGSTPLVARHFEEARWRGGVSFWRRLARFHPDFAVEKLRAAAENDLPDARLVWEARIVVNALAVIWPDRALALVTVLARHLPLGELALEILGLRRPVAVADLLLAADDEVHLSLDRAAHRLDARRLQALLESRPDTLAQPQVWFRRLPWHQRGAADA